MCYLAELFLFGFKTCVGYSEGDYYDFFESIFGADFHYRATGAHVRSEKRFSRCVQDIEIDMPIFLEDTLSDEKKTIAYNLPHYGGIGRMKDIRKTLSDRLVGEHGKLDQLQ